MSSVPQRDSLTGPDLTACDREPIHIPGAIEPQGVLLVVREPDLMIVQASANTNTLLGLAPEALLDQPLASAFDQESLPALRSSRLARENLEPRHSYFKGVRLRYSNTACDALVHRWQGLLIIELEPAEPDEAAGSEVYTALTEAMADLDGRMTLPELCGRVATHVRGLTGFDRVMVYRFLEDGSGSVFAEDRREDLTPYFGLRYPVSDVPEQARRLYLLNRLRLKADVSAERVPLVPPLNPVTGEPLDMTYCVLRAMSPVHDEYLRNMGVSASMSVSIVQDERLWGLIACHHTAPKTIPHRIRISCEVLARVFSARIAGAEEEDNREHVLRIHHFCRDMSERLRTTRDVLTAFHGEEDRLTSLARSQGAAICLGDDIVLFGVTPPREHVQRLAVWLADNQQGHLLCTDKLVDAYPTAQEFTGSASGLLSARIALGAPDFLLWFRPACVQVVHWGGDPSKPVAESRPGERLNPRRSFELWKETVRDRSEPWQQRERELAVMLRQVVAESLLVQRHEQLLRLNHELSRSNIELDAFAYAASHDLQEPVRTVRSYSQLLARRSATVLDHESRELIRVIEDAASRMGDLISALLSFAQVGGSKTRKRRPVNLEDVLRWTLMNLDESLRQSSAIVTNDPLPTVPADPNQLIQLLQNLVGNSVKYGKPDEPPVVHVSATLGDGMWHVSVRDNGQGFDPAQSELIFSAFKRLHGREIPGTGIGLALCQRIVEHHGGRIWAESKGRGYGATLWFTLPQS